MQQFLAVASASTGGSLQDWGNVAQLVLAVAAILALLGAAIQIAVTRAIDKRQLAYEYLHRFRGKRVSELATRTREFWGATMQEVTGTRRRRTWKDFEALSFKEQVDLLVFPNLIEELGGLYNRKRLDREVVALALGVLIERAWDECEAFIKAARPNNTEWAYCEWQEMRLDTQERRKRAHAKIERRRDLKQFFFGTGIPSAPNKSARAR